MSSILVSRSILAPSNLAESLEKNMLSGELVGRVVGLRLSRGIMAKKAGRSREKGFSTIFRRERRAPSHYPVFSSRSISSCWRSLIHVHQFFSSVDRLVPGATSTLKSLVCGGIVIGEYRKLKDNSRKLEFPVKKVIKRDGRVVDFDPTRIREALGRRWFTSTAMMRRA